VLAQPDRHRDLKNHRTGINYGKLNSPMGRVGNNLNNQQYCTMHFKVFDYNNNND